MQKKILYLEDDLTIGEVVVEYMELANYSVDWVTDGQIAFDLFQREHFDLLVFDIIVPTISGISLLEKINALGEKVPTIMLSALGDEATQLQAFSLFVDDYIIKPFSPVLLLKRMEAILRRSTTPIPLNRSLNFVIEQQTYQAYYQNKSLQLTLTEFSLLEKLATNPQRVFTRNMLLTHLFPDDHYPNDRIIDAHIKNLRKKIPKKYIKTIMGVGYQFAEGDD
ncbi:two-component regulatory system response regulator BaeR [Erysipelotrichaceae bacterium]|nr:two-component regulatory system response regulator BaeR [Erysipelotrichaceae bacterium]